MERNGWEWLSETRPDADREDRIRNRVSADDVGTAASANVDGRSPEDLAPSPGLSAAGGAAGGAAAMGTAGLVLGGPIGAMIGAVAGAVGGGWIGLASGESAEWEYGEHHDEMYRRHFEADDSRLADRSFEDARVAYQLGHAAAVNPDYEGRSFEEIEPDLRHGWTPEIAAQHGSWEQVRRYAQVAYETQREPPLGHGFVDLEGGGTPTHRRPSFSDPIPPDDPDGVAGPPPDRRV